jgi:hypothetical protein
MYSSATALCSWHFQAQIIKQAAWDSEWVGAPLNQQGALMFMTAAANQHFALTAGGFISLSQHTMIKVRHADRNRINRELSNI